MNTGPLSLQYGYSTDLFVSRKDNEQTLLVGGVGEGDRRWAHAMTQRAAQILWFKLTRLLYPDKADVVTGLATTAPLRSLSTPNLTTHVEVVRSAQAQYTLVGWVQRDTWKVLLSEVEARRLWAALDMALFPVGWEGRTTKVKKLN
jgi:hypothetical protein